MRRPIAIALVPVVIALAACGSSGSGGEPGSSSQTPGSHATSRVLDVATKAKLGSILVDARGRTLYRYTPDRGPKSTCTGGCAAAWPPATIKGSTRLTADDAVADGIVGTTTRPDGSKQLTLDGKPLYRFAQDRTEDDAKGQGVGGVWYVVRAQGPGSDDDAPVASTSKPTSSYGY